MPGLGIPITVACFHDCGKMLLVKALLKIAVNNTIRAGEKSLNTLLVIPSEPGAFLDLEY